MKRLQVFVPFVLTMSFATVPLPATWAAQPKVLRGHEKLDCLAIGPNGRTVVTGSLLDKTARVWDLSAADPAAKPKILHGHDKGIGCLAISLDGRWQSAMILSTAFGNVGNFGLPMALFAFGDEGLQQATIVFVASGILSFSLGIFVASRGHFTPAQAFLQIFKMPPIYATTTALLINAFNISLPEFINRPLILLGDGAIPVQLVMVGVQLASSSLRLRIYPDRSPHDWSLSYDPEGAGGKGRITASLDGQSCTLDLARVEGPIRATEK